MKNKLTTIQKIKVIAALAVVFLLVLATNQMDSNHFKIVKRTLITVYEDRLVAQDHIYQLSKHVQDKKLTIAQNQTINSSVNDSINALVELYAGTKLTTNESKHFDLLRSNLETLYKLERITDSIADASQQSSILTHLDLLDDNLDELSKIQLDEGKREIENSKKSISTSDLLSKLEIGVLIFIGLIIQALLFFKPLK